MNKMGMAEVVSLRDNTVYNDIQLIYKDLENYNIETAEDYKRSTSSFFKIIKNKDLHFLNEEDLQLKRQDIISFRNHMKSDGYNNKTINKKVIPIKQLLINMKASGYELDLDFFESIKKLPVKANKYGTFTVDEVLTLARLAKETERELKKEKSTLILFALDTCIRKSAILNLKWSDFVDQGNGEVYIKGLDKGEKEYRNKIKKSFYDELLLLKKEGKEKVFYLNKSTIEDMFKRLLKKMELPPERNLVFHSIRKAGVTFQYRVTGGDIKAAQKAANHSDPALTISTYVEDVDYGNFGAYSSQNDVDEDILDNLSLEQWKELKDKVNKDLQLLLKLKAKELFSNQNC